MVGEAGTEVCVPKVNEKSYSSTKDQQETAEGKILQAPTWLVAQSKALSRAVLRRQGSQGADQDRGIRTPCLSLSWLNIYLKDSNFKQEGTIQESFSTHLEHFVILFLIFVLNQISVLTILFKIPLFSCSSYRFGISSFSLQPAGGLNLFCIFPNNCMGITM